MLLLNGQVSSNTDCYGLLHPSNSSLGRWSLKQGPHIAVVQIECNPDAVVLELNHKVRRILTYNESLRFGVYVGVVKVLELRIKAAVPRHRRRIIDRLRCLSHRGDKSSRPRLQIVREVNDQADDWPAVAT